MEAVEKLAHQIYEERLLTGTPGNAESDWAQAEFEIKHPVGIDATSVVVVADPGPAGITVNNDPVPVTTL